MKIWSNLYRNIKQQKVGRGLADIMIQPQYDLDGTYYPAYGFFNNDDYRRIQPKNIDNILYGMIGSNTLNPKIHSNAYARLNSGLVRFLITEQEGRRILLSTEKGKRMKTEDRIKRLMPHELTTKLFEEMANLRLKKTGLDIQLEQINTKFPKDKYYSFAYGLWRIKELEDEAFKRKRRRFGGDGSTRQLVFFS